MWTPTQLRDDISGIFQTHAQEGAKVGDESHITGDLGLDSLGVMEVVAEIEDRYALMIPDDALPKMRTVGDVVAAITEQLRSEGRLS
jgi:acyl carrier protein